MGGERQVALARMKNVGTGAEPNVALRQEEKEDGVDCVEGFLEWEYQKKKKIEEESVFRAAFRHHIVSHHCASNFSILLILSTEFASSCAL